MQIEARTLDKETYDAVLSSVAEISQDAFKHLNIFTDAANVTMMRLIKTSLTTDMIKHKVQTIYPQVIEELFAKYHNIAFKYCLQKTLDPDLSNDIAQETITRLLRSQSCIEKVDFWIVKVAHNILCDHYKDKKQEQELYRNLSNEAALLNQLADNKDKTSIEDHLQSIPTHILNGFHYKSYLQLKEHNNLKSYAEANKFSYEAAKSTSKKIMRDLKSEILLAMGWEATPDILDYRQYKAIQGFIRKLLLLFSADEMRRKNELQRLHQDLPEVLDGYKSIEDWGVTLIGERRFRLYLFHLSDVPPPLMSTTIVSISKTNHICIEECKRNVHAGTFGVPSKVQIPKQMGRALWSYEVIISYLKEK